MTNADLKRDARPDDRTVPDSDSLSSRERVEFEVDARLWVDLPDPPQDSELVELRRLLFERELLIIRKLQENSGDFQYNAQKICEALPKAVQMSIAEDSRLNAALEPVVDEIVRLLLRKRRNDFVDSLFPLMGPSIRKSIAETFRSMLGSFSKSVEMSFSWKGLRWRLEALRSGKSFSEIVMLNTLLYRVEQIFFIHSETGIALAHVAAMEDEAQDADMVSAMFTAIQDFARDCFAKGRDEDLEALRLGDFTVLIEKTSKAYLAAVVRGTPPVGFSERLRALLETLLLDYDEPLSNFSGDTAPFVSAEARLDDCLLSSYAEEIEETPFWARVFPACLVVFIVLLLGSYWFYRGLVSNEMQEALNILRAEPGLLITDIDRDDGEPWDVTVLKDTHASLPAKVLESHGLDPALFSFTVVPFVSHDPAMIMKRVERIVDLPKGVEMTFDGKGTVSFSGTAPMAWIVSTREAVRALPGVEKVDISGLKDPTMDRIVAMIESIESTTIEFPLGKDTPAPEDAPKLQRAVDTLAALEKIVKDMGFSVSLTIFGHADTVGSEKRNYEISQARARTVAAMLYARGSSMPISLYGMGAEYPKKKDDGGDSIGQASRRVELRVHVQRSVDVGAETFMFLKQ